MTNRQYSRALVTKKKRLEEIWSKRIFIALKEQKAGLIAAAKKGIGPALSSIFLIDDKAIRDVLTRLYVAIGPKEASWQYRTLMQMVKVKKGYSPLLLTKAGFGTDIDFQSDVTEYLNRYILDMVSAPMTQVTKDKVRRILIDGTALGQSYDQILDRLTDTELDGKRARMIARTEVNRAVNAGHFIGRKDVPFVVDKVWISARDMRTRGHDKHDKADHYHNNEQLVGEDDPFIDSRSGSKLNFPGDSSLGALAADVINCRCNGRYIPKRDPKTGRLIMRVAGKPTLPALPSRPNVIEPAITIKPGNGLPNLPTVVPAMQPKPITPPASITTPADTPAVVANRIKDKLKATYGINFKDPVLAKAVTVSLMEKYEAQIDKLSSEYKIYSGYKSYPVELIFRSTSGHYGRVQTSNFGSILHEVNFGNTNDQSRSRITTERFRPKSQVDTDKQDIATVTHEFAHFITIFQQEGRNDDAAITKFWPELKKLKRQYLKEVKQAINSGNNEEVKRLSLGLYAGTNANEFMAEAFTEYKLFSNPTKFAILVGKLIDLIFGK